MNLLSLATANVSKIKTLFASLAEKRQNINNAKTAIL